jgi:hypothetical protein
MYLFLAICFDILYDVRGLWADVNLRFADSQIFPKAPAFSSHIPQHSFAMRNTLIFAGSSCPALTAQICSNLGMAPAAVELSQFANVRATKLFSFIWLTSTGRDQRQDHDEYSRKGCVCGPIR